MTAKLKTTLFLSLCLASVPISAGGSSKVMAQDAASASPSAPEAVSFSLKRGEVLQIIASDNREDGRQARLDYFTKVLPLAQTEGYRRLAQLNVRESVISETKPDAFSFFAWPSEAAEKRFSQNPDWPEYRQARPEGWDELAIYTATLSEDLSLTFSPNKYYTVVVAWPDPETGADYSRYLEGIEPAVTRAGGRFIAKIYNPRFEAHASPEEAPGQLTFVEWDSLDGFQKVQKMPEYLAHRDYFASGLNRFEFHWMELAR
ncbi:hypothetical protein KUW15_11775 [Qipengyuania aquimaris]|uniref:hypothetical protein n=1 Tax=Qipengyuania aquimaris TaxID=255984 RepID=UPI001C9630EB|nr:hypothetical protein [Qipengyuania aquimaris]MBY6129397.1 hypothetical protein [Qipengyuania aquimaris]